MNKLMKKVKNKKGFTLIELIVVIAILGILAAIAVPRFLGATEKANQSAHNANVAMIESAAELAAVNNVAVESITVDYLATNGYLSSVPDYPFNSGVSYVVTVTAVTETLGTRYTIAVTPAKDNFTAAPAGGGE